MGLNLGPFILCFRLLLQFLKYGDQQGQEPLGVHGKATEAPAGMMATCWSAGGAKQGSLSARDETYRLTQQVWKYQVGPGKKN